MLHSRALRRLSTISIAAVPAVLTARRVCALSARSALCEGDSVFGWKARPIIAGTALPLLCNYKHGAGRIYAAAMFVRAYGATPEALYRCDAFFAALTAGLTALVAARCGKNRLAGLAAGLLLCSTPSFLDYSTCGIDFGIIETALGLAAVGALLMSADRESRALAALSGALLGTALFCKTTHAAYAIGFASFFFAYRKTSAAASRLAPAFAAAFALVVAPMALALLASPSARGYWTLHMFSREDGTNNLSYLPNLAERVRQLWTLIAGAGPQFWAFPAAFLVGLARVVAKRKVVPAAVALPWILAAVYLASSPLSPSLLHPQHLLAALPLLAVAAASTLRLWRRKAAVWSLLALAGLQTLSATRGVASGAIGLDTGTRSACKAASWFQARPDLSPVALSDSPVWAFAYLLGTWPLTLPLNSTLSPGEGRVWREAIKDPALRFVIDLGADDRPLAMLTLSREAARGGFRVEREAEIGVEGSPAIAIERVRRLPTSGAASARRN